MTVSSVRPGGRTQGPRSGKEVTEDEAVEHVEKAKNGGVCEARRRH